MSTEKILKEVRQSVINSEIRSRDMRAVVDIIDEALDFVRNIQ